LRGLVIAGTHSGVGKTIVATGLMVALSRHGYRVQPFKAGPDYIDPSYHTAVCGVPSRNLDTWLLKPSVVRELFQRAMRGKDLAIVEGVMGLYDGFRGEDDEGSTAQLSKLLRLPVVLVVDASAAARSVGATVLGFKNFDPQLNVVGVVLNGIAGEAHLRLIQPALAQVGVPLLGYLPRSPDLILPERHLGLIPTLEGTVAKEFYERLLDQVERTVDLERIASLAAPISVTSEPPCVFPESPQPTRAVIAIAMDKAFNFYYPDSLDLLQAWGAEIVPFSPLEDQKIPEGVGGVYIGGGFPELYAEGLSTNAPMLQSLMQAAEQGLPIYAECGGLMYLSQGIEDQQERTYAMAGIVPAWSSMKGKSLTVGYRTVCAVQDSPLMKAGDQVRGHEFHLSALTSRPHPAAAVYRILDQDDRMEGYRVHNVVASYIHLHMGSRRDLAPRFVDFCARQRPRGQHEVRSG